MRDSDIAIVGMGAILPGGLTVPECWQMITGKRSSIGEVPPSQWEADLYYDPDPKAYYRTNSKIGGFLPDDLGFRARDFGMPPILKEHLDPTQQLALLTARQTLEDAKAADRQPRNWAVYVGNLLGGSWKRGEQWIRTQHEKTKWQLQQSEVYRRLSPADQQALNEAIQLHLTFSQQPNMTPDSLPGLLGNLIASRIAHYFNLLGPNFTIDAACATSLAAIEQAVIGLRNHRFDAALAGGVDRIMDASSFIGFSKMGVLSPTHSAPFDASANGFVMGEGSAMFVLKRLEDAIDQGDKIYALIKGVGSSTDGPGRSIAAPNPEGQRRSLHQAYADAQIDPATVDLIECHGTSTPIGDPTEIAALRQMFQGRGTSQRISIGSIKSNIGHLKGAAGAAAMLKTTLALYHKILPPQINFSNPNPHCEFETSPFRVQTEVEPWEAPSNSPRRSGVSAFGFGGINYHIVLEEFSMASSSSTGVTFASASSTPKGSLSSSPAPLPLDVPIFAIGANSRTEIAQQARNWVHAIEQGETNILPGLREAPTISQQHCRVAFYAKDVEETKTLLELLANAMESGKGLKKLEAKGVYLREGEVEPGRVAYMFPGQGSQYVHMLSELKEHFSIVQETLDEADEIMKDILPKPLSEYLAPPPDMDDGVAFFELLQTEVLQPAVLTADYAMWRLLKSLLPVELVIGHSLGEYGAAVAAGVFAFGDALRIVAARGEAIAAVADKMDDVGVMIGVGADAEKVEALLKEANIDGYVIVANKNCPTQTIIAGATKATMAAAEFIETQGVETVQLPVSHAFHSDIVAPASPFLLKELEKIEVSPPQITILSNETATPYPTDENAPQWIRDTLSVHLARPVEWQAMIEWAYQEGFRTFVEVGPKRALSSFARDVLAGREHRSYFSSHPKFGEMGSLGRMLAALTADGLLPYGTEKPTPKAATLPQETLKAAATAAPFTLPQAVGSLPTENRSTMPEPRPNNSHPTATATHPMQNHTAPSAFSAPAPATFPPAQATYPTQMPYAQPGHPTPFATPMLPLQPHYGFAPMYGYHQPPVWMDPGFWHFLAAQGPHLMQHLMMTYQAMRPSHPIPPMYNHGVNTNYMPTPTVAPTYPTAPVAHPTPTPQQPATAYPTMPSLPQWQATPKAPAYAPTPDLPTFVDLPGQQPQQAWTQPAPAMPAAPAMPTAPAMPAAPATPAAPAAVDSVADNLESMILNLVAERTGYELDELGLDEHLEADLGIDSIRQVEVMAELRDSLALPRDDSFKITDYPTLRSLITYVNQNIPNNQKRESSSASDASG